MDIFPITTPTIIFVGSSIMEGWFNLPQFFPNIPILNTAIGGTQTHEIHARLDELVIRHRPRLVCYYCGSNDINNGASAALIAANVRQTFTTLRQALPAARFLYLSIIKAPQKRERWDVVDEVNRQLSEMAAQTPDFHFLDINPIFFTAQGEPRADFYVEDQLHLTPAAYTAMGVFSSAMIHRLASQATTQEAQQKGESL